jgi:nitrate/nitrite-specific signal transduction histidine kinase
VRRRFILAFVALFTLFAVGIVTSLVFIWQGTTELRDVLAAHQIEELRQSLSRSLQRSERDLQVSGTVFANQLDDIIANVQDLDQSVQGCFGCHHEPALRGELEKIAGLVETYKQQYSTFITAFLNQESRQRLQFEAAATAEEIDDIVDALLAAASPRLQRRTQAATAQVERSWTSLVVTLLLTFVAAIAVSLVLTRSVTDPLGRLAAATARIGRGELGYRIEHQQRHELGAVMDAFNTMSETLESKTERIEHHVQKLHKLNESVVALYAQPDKDDLFARQVEAIDSLMEAEFRGNIVASGLEGVFLVRISRRGETTPEYRTVISAQKLEAVRERGSHSLLVVAQDQMDGWPFGAWAPPEEPRNYLVSWVDWQGEFRGALFAANKSSGDFEAEDGELLVALGQALGAAVDNASDYESLQAEMAQLKSEAGPKPQV